MPPARLTALACQTGRPTASRLLTAAPRTAAEQFVQTRRSVAEITVAGGDGDSDQGHDEVAAAVGGDPEAALQLHRSIDAGAALKRAQLQTAAPAIDDDAWPRYPQASPITDDRSPGLRMANYDKIEAATSLAPHAAGKKVKRPRGIACNDFCGNTGASSWDPSPAFHTLAANFPDGILGRDASVPR